MSGTTTELGLATAVDSDDNADYLTINLANSLRTVDGLFNNITGHTHGGAHQGGTITPAAGSITSGMIADGTIATADLANASVTNAKLAADTARDNLLTNGGMEVWSRGIGPFSTTGSFTCDRWGISLAGSDTLSVSKHTTAANLDVGSQAAAACTFVLGSGGGLSQFFVNMGVATDGLQVNGRTLSLSVRVKCSVANAVRIGLNNYYSSANHFTYSSFHTGSGNYETLTVTAAIDSTATIVAPTVFFAASCTAYLDNAMLVVGSQAADYVPLHPAEDLARCLRYYEKLGGTVAADLYYSAYQSAGFAAGVTLLFGTKKAVTPVVTKVGTWSVTNCGQPVLDTPAVHGCRIYALTTALGSMSYAVSDATTYVTAEANA